ncbi:ABC transporter ATP-binding protein [Streptomyces sp. NBC_01210]|uniref:ABC transporter ATP-binding protein n=1 Tax=Streptomyces sp. NBC_01210 TaxID=2903774 RepID=UPI002E1631C5
MSSAAPSPSPARTPRNRPVARAVALSKTHGRGKGRVVALDEVSLQFNQAELTAIMGASGSGKSTLLHCMAGLDIISSGSVYIGDTELSTLSERQLTRLRRDRIGFIFQTLALLPSLSAAENITLPMDAAGRQPDPVWVSEVVASLRLTDRLHQRPAELSHSQQQRVMCAQALASKPEIVFVDDPTANLDSRAAREVLRLLQGSVRRLRQTVVMVTHDPVTASCADRIVHLADGHIVDEVVNAHDRTHMREMAHQIAQSY